MSVDFFTVPTVFFDVLYVFVVLAHRRRQIVHVNVTANPSAEWTAQQITNAFPWDTAPRYMLRDRDGIYGARFRSRMKNMGVNEVLIAARSPWQNPYVERVIGTEQHLRRLLRSYLDDYYHPCRTHLSLSKDSPAGREVERSEMGEVIELPVVGGLHHRYRRRAA
ncbi:MAG: transposase [Deltaproteobacteria bacterium]|nr:transposase [Deltaproteobacteria bacterium]